MVLALALQYGDALRMPFLGDDYSILDKVRTASFAALWERSRLLYYWYRPWSRELHYWTLERLFGAREPAFHLASFALWACVMALYFALARRLIGGRAAALACAGVAALAAWAGALTWVAGVQELWMLLFAILFLHAFARRSTPLALALLSKETAAVLPAIALVWAQAVDRDPPARALARIVPFAVLIAGWLAFHPWLRAQLAGPLPGNTEVLDRPGPAGIAARFALSLLNLDQRPAPPHGAWPALLGGLAGVLVLVAFAVASSLMTPPAARGGTQRHGAGAVASAWTLAGALPLFAPSIGWHAYYGLLAALGAWLGLGAVLARRPVVALLLVALVATLRPLRAETPSWDWSSRSYQERAGFFLGRMRDDLLRQHPSVPPRSRLYFFDVPQNIGFMVGDGAAVRVWYRDSTLRAGYLSDYRPRAAADTAGAALPAAGRDLFFRYDTTNVWIELVKGAEDIEAARRADPEWESDHRKLALVLGTAGDWGGAAAELEKLAAAFPDNYEYPLNLAHCEEELGDAEAVRRCYTRAAAIPGGAEIARKALVDFETRLRERPWPR